MRALTYIPGRRRSVGVRQFDLGAERARGRVQRAGRARDRAL